MFSAASGDGALRFKRNPKVPGPISVFGYDYVRDKLGEEKYSKLRLLEHNGLRGAGGDYAYEALNWSYWNLRAVDIANFLSATYGPVPVEYVIDFLKAAEDAGLVTRVDDKASCNPGR
jgi:hypothetical protein